MATDNNTAHEDAKVGKGEKIQKTVSKYKHKDYETFF